MKTLSMSIAVFYIFIFQMSCDAYAILYNVTGDISEGQSQLKGEMDIELVFKTNENVYARIDILNFKLGIEDYVFGGTGKILNFYGTDGAFSWSYEFRETPQSWNLEDISFFIMGNGDIYNMSGGFQGPAFFEEWVYYSQEEILAITLPESFTIKANYCAFLFENGWYERDPLADFHFTKAPVPEPASVALVGGGCILLVGFYRMKRIVE